MKWYKLKYFPGELFVNSQFHSQASEFRQVNKKKKTRFKIILKKS